MHDTTQPPTADAQRTARPDRLVGITVLLAVCSGLTALIYQVVWNRWFAALFGVSWHAMAAVVAVFLGGLAAGSYWWGAWADRRGGSGLRLYACLEFGVVAAVIAGAGLLQAIDPVHLWLANRSEPQAVLLLLARVGLAGVIIGPPTFLMGGTLPALVLECRAVDAYRRQLGRIYAANTGGAVLGVLLASFLLIRWWGLAVTLTLALVVNVLVVGTAWWASRRKAEAETLPAGLARRTQLATGGAAEPDHRSRHFARVGLVTVLLAGFVALCLQIVWIRLAVLTVGTSGYAYAIVVSTFLSGITVGAAVLGIGSRGGGGPAAQHGAGPAAHGTPGEQAGAAGTRASYGWLQLGIALSLPLSLWGLAGMSGLGGEIGLTNWASQLAAEAAGWHGWLSACLRTAAVILVPTALMGMALPTAASWLRQSGYGQASAAGYVLGASAAGNILGALSAGFVMVPLLGLQHTVLACGLVSCLIAVWGLWPAAGVPLSATRLVIRAGVWVAVLAALTAIWYQLDQDPLVSAVQQDPWQVMFYEEGPIDTVAVLQHRQDPQQMMMAVDGVVIGQTRVDLDEKQQWLAHFPMLIRSSDAPQQALTIGLGTGILASELARHPLVAQLDVVELSPSVIAASAEFARFHAETLTSPEVRLIRDDGIFYLRRGRQPLDLIVSDGKSVHTHAGNAAFFSRDYYDRCRQRLSQRGIFIQWLPLSTPQNQLRTIYRSLRGAFEHVYLWCEPPFSLYWVGTRRPLAWDASAIDQRLADSAAASLRQHGWASADQFVVLLLADKPLLEAEIPVGPVNSLDHPLLEFFRFADYAQDAASRVEENLQWFQRWPAAGLRDLQWDPLTASQLSDLGRTPPGLVAVLGRGLESRRRPGAHSTPGCRAGA